MNICKSELLKNCSLKELYFADFDGKENDFLFEGPSGSFYINNSSLFINSIDDAATLWLKKIFSGDLYISYNACARLPDVATNINFFFLMSGLNGKNAWELDLSGAYNEYHKQTKGYITTFTGEYIHGHSRIRREPGFALLKENNIASKPEHIYKIEIIKKGKNIEYWVDNKLINSAVDDNPYKEGALAFRTWKSNLEISEFLVCHIENL